MISIVIPVYNEENRLEENLRKIDEFLKGFNEKTELILVNDGSSDKTAEILDSLKDTYKLRVINQEKNKGKGAAIKTGVNASLGEWVLFTDIDLSVPIEFLQSFYAGRDDADILIGSREHKDSTVEVKQFFLREFAGGIFTLLTNLILWVGVTDFTCGFKMFKLEAAKKIFNKQLINRWAFDAESLFLAKKFGYKIKEMPVVWRHGEGSKVRFPQDLIESFFGLWQIRLNDLSDKYD